MTIPAEAFEAVRVSQSALGDTLLAVYLHGSAVAGGLRPRSDVDILIVVDQPLHPAARTSLLAGLLRISGRYPPAPGGPHPLELTVFRRDDLAVLSYPMRSEFQYGEWLRAEFEAGRATEAGSSPDYTLLLAQARQQAIALLGPDPSELLPSIPAADIRQAIGDCLPALIDFLAGDERNVLLTLARMWRTLATGDFVSKDTAADWAIPGLPPEVAALIGLARDGYLAITEDDWQARGLEARHAASHLRERITARL